MVKYLFSFNFENNTINSYIVEYLKKNNIDYFYHYQEIYADIFGVGSYFKIELIDRQGTKKEIFFNTEKLLNC